jgi:hypothetical protein
MEGRIMWLFLPNNVGDAYHPWWTKNLSYIQHPLSMNAVLLPTTHTHTNNIFIYILIISDNITWEEWKNQVYYTFFYFKFLFLKKKKEKEKSL